MIDADINVSRICGAVCGVRQWWFRPALFGIVSTYLQLGRWFVNLVPFALGSFALRASNWTACRREQINMHTDIVLLFCRSKLA